MTHLNEINDERPYVVVRWRDQDVRKPALADPKRGVYIPGEFEAGIVTSDVRVNFKLQATELLREIYEIAGHEPPVMEGPVIVKAVTVTSDAFSFVPADRLRRLPFKTYVRLAVAAAGATQRELRFPGDEPSGGAGTMDEWRERKVFFDEVARHPVGRPPHKESDCFYNNFGKLIYWQEVLDVSTQGGGKSTKALMEHFDIARKTAQRWKKDAAERGKVSRGA